MRFTRPAGSTRRHSGWACSAFFEVTTVFTNEYFDLESDRRNKNFGPFTGGSRVLVDGRINLGRMRLGIARDGRSCRLARPRFDRARVQPDSARPARHSGDRIYDASAEALWDWARSTWP